jgi:deoxypyrimidine-specific 5' nucleotidase type C protein (NT5C)
MPLRIAFDMDGVLADMERALVDHAEGLFGADESAVAAPADAPDIAQPVIAKLRITPRQEHRLWDRVEATENFWQSLNEIEPGIVARLHALSVERRWEVIFLTKRPATAGATAQVQTQRWLQARGFALPSVYVVQRSRGQIAAALALDFVVDDRPENCLDVAVDSKARPILVWRVDETQLPAAIRRLGIGVVGSVSQCLDILAEIDVSEESPGMVTRVLRLLGLKEPAET